MDRTNIIDNDEVERAMALASPGKGKGKGKQKATEARASSPPKPKKTTKTVATASATAKASASATPVTTAPSTQASAPRFYEENGLKIPLYNQDGLGNKKRQCARLSKTLLKNNTDQLLDIVGQYAGAAKRQELKNKGLSKSRLANWIEEKETLALGRNPRSTLTNDEDDEAESGDEAASFLTTTDPISSGTNTKKNTATTSDSNDEHDSPFIVKNQGMCDQPSRQKRGAPDEAPDDQPPAKLQKRDEPANSVATNTGRSAEYNPVGMSVDDIPPTHPQTGEQTVAYNDKDYDIHAQNTFMQSIGMDPSDIDRSSVIIRDDSEDRVFTATSRQSSRGVNTILYETTIPHNATNPPESIEPPPVPYLKAGVHGRRGDFQADADRRTGLGHQIEPDDQLKWNQYKAFRNTLFKQYSDYRKPVNGAPIDPDEKTAWSQWEQWYAEFGKKYPGYAVNHLWPCGCEKVSDGDESEEE